MKAIVNTKLIMEDGIIWDGAVTFDNEKILAVGDRREVDITGAEEVYDAGGLYTAPGLVDMHNHGSAEHSFAADPAAGAGSFYGQQSDPYGGVHICSFCGNDIGGICQQQSDGDLPYGDPERKFQ